MKIYKIPITYMSFEEFTVEAENLQDAVTKGLSEFLSIPDDKYLDNSFEIDPIIYENYPNEKLNMSLVIEKL